MMKDDLMKLDLINPEMGDLIVGDEWGVGIIYYITEMVVKYVRIDSTGVSKNYSYCKWEWYPHKGYKVVK